MNLETLKESVKRLVDSKDQSDLETLKFKLEVSDEDAKGKLRGILLAPHLGAVKNDGRFAAVIGGYQKIEGAIVQATIELAGKRLEELKKESA